MIISQGRRYIFVHMPKTGGTAMSLALEARALKDDILIGDTPKARRRAARQKALPAKGRLWKHATLADIEGIVDPEAFDDFFLFTLVRNPWDRMVSYYHWLRAQRFAHPAVTLAQSTRFGDFLRDPLTQAAWRHAGADHYLTDSAGRLRAGHYLRLEHLEEDLAPLAAHLGFRPVLERVNASERPRDYRSCYTPEEAALVGDLSAADSARFGYRFDP